MEKISKQYKQLYEIEKKNCQRLKKENETLRRQLLLIPDRAQFSERDEAIIDYIRKNHGTIKVKVIEKLSDQGFGTYVTLHKAIRKLTDPELNMIRIEEVHKQKHRLYLNENSLLLEVHTDLTNFKNSFDELLDKVSMSKKWQEYRNSGYLGVSLEADRLLHSLILIYKHVFNVYLTNILLRWSVELRDDEFLLNKIYSLILFSFIEIQTEFVKKFDLANKLPDFDKASMDDIGSPILGQITSKGFFLDPYTIMAIMQEFSKFGLHLDIVPLIDVSWKIGKNLYRFIEIPFLNQFEPQIKEIVTEDWKALLSFYLQEKIKKEQRDSSYPFQFPSKFIENKWPQLEKKSIKMILDEIINSGHQKK